MIAARNHLQRLLGLCIAAAIVLGCVPTVGDTVGILTMDAAVSACASTNAHSVTTIQKSQTPSKTKKTICDAAKASTTPYVLDVLEDEIRAIVTYAKGQNPNEGKTIEEKGQNTKSNVALTLIFLIKNSKPVRSLRFELLPYGNEEKVYELCVFYKTLFDKQEQVYRSGVLHDYNTETIYTVDGTGILGIGYDFNFDFNEFSSSADPWQRDFGFCRQYDQLAFLIGDVYNTIRVPFTYDGKDWMIQIWKGTYSYNMLGAEIGIYNKPADRQALYYDCAADPDRMEMALTVYLDGEELVSAPMELKWWQTKFTYHILVDPDSLALSATIKFPSKGMMQAFAESLSEADSSVTYTVQGTTLSFFWPAS